MTMTTEKVRNNLCKHITKTSTNNSNFAYIFAATENAYLTNEVSYAANGNSDQLIRMLATAVACIAKSAGVSYGLIIEYVIEELNSQKTMRCKMTRDIPKAGEIYKHFKGNYYQIINIAAHSETKSPMVVYSRLSDNTLWVRPLDMFLSKVDKEKYPDIAQEWRFEKVQKT